MPYIKTQRRRGASSSRRRSIGRLWKRAMDSVPEGLAIEVGFAGVLVVGLALAASGGSRNLIAGATACTIGATVLLWRCRIRWTNFQQDRQLRITTEAQIEKRRIRRERGSDEQEGRQKRSAVDSAAQKKAKAVAALVRTAEQEHAEAERRYRRGREEAIARDAMRLLTMSEIALLEAASEAFETRGFFVGRDVDDSRRDMLLRGDKGDVRIVARLAPLGKKVEVADVEGLDEWRGEVGAAAGILIGIAGFTPDAVRKAGSLPVTLVEAHLLAQWRVGGSLDGRMPETSKDSSATDYDEPDD